MITSDVYPITGADGYQVVTTTSITQFAILTALITMPQGAAAAIVCNVGASIVAQFKLTGENTSETGLVLPVSQSIFLPSVEWLQNFVFRGASAGTTTLGIQFLKKQ